MAQDYNPDKEKHRKRKYVVIKADPKLKSVPSSKGNLEFGKDNAFVVSDPVFANEIRQTVGVDATVSRVNADVPADRGHVYFFGGWPEMPWKRGKDGSKDSEAPEGSQESGSGQSAQDAVAKAEEGQEEPIQPAYLHPPVEDWAYAIEEGQEQKGHLAEH